MPIRSDLQWLIDSSQPSAPAAPAAASSPVCAMNTTPSTPSTVAKEWDQLRTAFASSLLVNTPLHSLAQNLDGLEWPIRGANETPAAYIDLGYDELVSTLTNRGQPAAASLLVQILRETLAFDQPFGEMVQQTEASAARDNPLLRNLARLGIPENFPLELTSLDDSARQLCRLESVGTIGEFAVFAQRLAQGVIIGGDLRRMLNALAHFDEATLATIVPFRVGSTGVHLAEALAQAARSPTPEEQVARTLAWFSAEFASWREQAAADRKFLPRQFSFLSDLRLEEHLSQLLAPHLRSARPDSTFGAKLRRWLHL
ncbi:hypothetical protein [Opitutus terrae]|uniref:Uncharacterized protein n=1 Tax=Opitutus terrae (strain DSM 11246 / JCM 15787 / PB90-1) TaxID=452637 RepID=B1ZWB8_OPITP|nr:hypothetical protein [Opitutus terrae]ACB76870.1 hypothetical protein Oter_3593 [Opitutus terrae PB90-1]